MRKIVLSLAVVAAVVEAVELRVAYSNFESSFGIEQLFTGDLDIDVTTFSLVETHRNIFDSNFYYAFDLSLYKSKELDQMTTFFAQPLTHEFPFFGSISENINKYTPLTAPVDYKVRGIDFTLQIGYDLYRDDRSFFGVALTTGISMPYMKMYDMKKALKLTLQMLDTTKTKVRTYKLGIGYSGAFSPLPYLHIYSRGSINGQTGKIKNSWVRSSFDSDGTNYNFDLGLRYDLNQLFPKLDGLFCTLGYSYKKWEVDDTRVTLLDTFQFNFSPYFSMDMETSQVYFGIGYQF
ncbi:MAG: hypothetical protein GXO19_05165 [Epsilonproteobacteria bacterium]|nr:hypothetical protein [Campylobacterota bacterium]NPA57108.1 hypothetical protein [Campylobacterota bacterium]